MRADKVLNTMVINPELPLDTLTDIKLGFLLHRVFESIVNRLPDFPNLNCVQAKLIFRHNTQPLPLTPHYLTLAVLAEEYPKFRPEIFKLSITSKAKLPPLNPTTRQQMIQKTLPFVTDFSITTGTPSSVTNRLSFPNAYFLTLNSVTALPEDAIPFALNLTTLRYKVASTSTREWDINLRLLPALKRLIITVGKGLPRIVQLSYSSVIIHPVVRELALKPDLEDMNPRELYRLLRGLAGPSRIQISRIRAQVSC